MSKATVLTLVSDLTLGAASDSTIVGNYYDRVVEDLARYPWLTNISIVGPIDPVNLPGKYTLETNQVKVLAVWWDNKMLSELTLAQAEGLNRTWRNERGEPHSYVVEDDLQKSFTLFPVPTVDAKPQVFPHSQPLGLDFPAYSVVVLHTETRIDCPTWIELPIALETAAREMERESVHRDLEWAKQAHAMADALFGMVGGS